MLDQPPSTLLIIDDSATNLTMLSSLLQSQYKVKVAINGEKGLRLAKTSPPDLILLDIMMPVMDGFEVCIQLKKDPSTTHIPIIFLSGKNEITDEEKCRQIGAAGYIVKPIDPDTLLLSIQQQLLKKQGA
ncbi:response regulator [Iodobacter fluviatilis]|uniref:Response regulator receiver domain-containing protein n=1 Tax=Iodobacter fluviatilis TaxID=537 RepID=A0A377Q4X1_9NEIS|nr:response regulator [Iodobacter fluviatilis]TCU84156.1 response regulator receiver domain-containing protein [Iodobacter fluviatilis]STQ89770.1 Stalked cell differentiation-controlling protein [Iodobacter fluviatilis]